MILGKHIGSIRIIWTVFGIYDIPTQLWVSRDLDKQGNSYGARLSRLLTHIHIFWRQPPHALQSYQQWNHLPKIPQSLMLNVEYCNPMVS